MTSHLFPSRPLIPLPSSLAAVSTVVPRFADVHWTVEFGRAGRVGLVDGEPRQSGHAGAALRAGV